MVKLGNKVRDLITGFEGIAVGRAEYLYGCARVCVEPQAIKDGKPLDTAWFDEQRIEVIEERAIPVSRNNSATSGGPTDNPGRAADPAR